MLLVAAKEDRNTSPGSQSHIKEISELNKSTRHPCGLCAVDLVTCEAPTVLKYSGKTLRERNVIKRISPPASVRSFLPR